MKGIEGGVVLGKFLGQKSIAAYFEEFFSLSQQELDLKQVHKKKEHETLISQHDSTQTLEYRQLHAIQELRMERLRLASLLSLSYHKHRCVFETAE